MKVKPGSGSVSLPLTLYIHTPWCVSKCSYCDFNSHVWPELPFESYVTRLLADLDQELQQPTTRRTLSSIYIGGGTPSLFPGESVRRLLNGVRSRVDMAPDVEISLEANPGTGDASNFVAYRAAGVNRLSIGVQSLSATPLRELGRTHGPEEVRETVRLARAAGFANINLDMMFGLPEQDLLEAGRDLAGLIALEPEHISYYELTLEPNTRMHADPPCLPDPDLVADMAELGLERLRQAGYGQYEVSAYARDGARCRHNLNYWHFGDYLGIGAGAHGKLSQEAITGQGRRVRRTAKRRHPAAYLSASAEALCSSARELSEHDLIFEFALNSLRLTDGIACEAFTLTTGLPWARIANKAQIAEQDGMLRILSGRLVPTALGRRFVDDLVARFAIG